MIAVKTFIKRNVSRNSCTTWQLLYWTKLFSAITFGLKQLQSLLSNKKADVLLGKTSLQVTMVAENYYFPTKVGVR